MANVDKVYKALYAFKALEQDELSLKPGDLIDVCFKHSGDWGVGTSRRTKKLGSFPWSYVEEVLQDQPPPVPRSKKPVSSPAPSSNGPQADYENVPVGGYRPSTSASAGPARPTGKKRPQAVTEATTAGQQGLQQYSWFAGSMNRLDAEARLKNRPNGTFLVRVSLSGGGFALSLTFIDCRHIKIHKSSEGKFGFTDEGQHDSVAELIQHFQKESLQDYNAELETKLLYSYKDAPVLSEADAKLEEVMDEDIYTSSREMLRQSMANKSNVRIDFNSVYASEKVLALDRRKTAQDTILTLLKEQKDVLQKSSLHAPQQDRQKISVNMSRIIRMINDREYKLKQTIQSLREAQIEEDKRQEAEGLQGRANENAPIEPVPSDPETSLFYVGIVNRDTAEEMLKRQPDGTYLIRKSDTRITDPYTLSLRYLNTTKHILIKYDGTRFGFADPLAFYHLQGLCDYYKANELSLSIKTKLKRAIKEK
eukprot:m.43815 g.43815  ORF g.43815 m.43815 type:complete len:480 (-) comp10011_c0_seq1:67-1506(-)